MARLCNSKAGAYLVVEIDGQHLNAPCAQSLGQPTIAAHARGRVVITEREDEPAVVPATPERDELQSVPSDLVELRSLQASLVREDLYETCTMRPAPFSLAPTATR